MAKQIRLSGVTINNPSAPNVEVFKPPLGVPGYTRRLRASQFSALVDGTTIATPWPDLIGGEALAVVGAPRRGVTTNGLTTVNCLSAAIAGFTQSVAPLWGTFVVVHAPYASAANAGKAFAVLQIGGRQMIYDGATWKLQAESGTNDHNFAIAAGTHPLVNDQRMISILSLSPDGMTDSIRVVGGGHDVSASGQCDKSEFSGMRFGKQTGGTTVLGNSYLSILGWGQKLLTTGEQVTVIAALKSLYGVV
jgi:hypothetical protein